LNRFFSYLPDALRANFVTCRGVGQTAWSCA
jgi:hypothetical protein